MLLTDWQTDKVKPVYHAFQLLWGMGYYKVSGFWKFNSSLLNVAYVTKIKEIINNVSENYLAIDDKSM